MGQAGMIGVNCYETTHRCQAPRDKALCLFAAECRWEGGLRPRLFEFET